MSKFGLPHEEEDASSTDMASFVNKLAAFPTTTPRHRINVAAVDAAAAPHGFVSREAKPEIDPVAHAGRRRRITPVEPTRHLAIRLTASQYNRFVAYADKHKLTYHDALGRLLEYSDEE